MKKTLHIIKNIFVWLVVAVAVCMMIFTVVSVNTSVYYTHIRAHETGLYLV